MPRILVVDDNMVYREAMAAVLRARGYEAVCAADGGEALAAAAVHEPDLVLMDLMMPGIDGFELLERLRKTARGMAVIVMSASSDERHAARAVELGADEVMLKSRFSVAELVGRIEHHLARAKAA